MLDGIEVRINTDYFEFRKTQGDIAAKTVFTGMIEGIPEGGYTKIIEKMLDGIEVRINTDYFEFRKTQGDIAAKTVFTGMIDEYFQYAIGVLEYRTVRFETEVLDMENYQGNAVVNYTDREVPYTRIIEHKHFEFGKQKKTVISREYSTEWEKGMEPYYPVNDEKNTGLYQKYRELAEKEKNVIFGEKNTGLYQKYRELAEKEKNVIFGGRLGSYQYYDMDKVVRAALDAVEKEFL